MTETLHERGGTQHVKNKRSTFVWISKSFTTLCHSLSLSISLPVSLLLSFAHSFLFPTFSLFSFLSSFLPLFRHSSLSGPNSSFRETLSGRATDGQTLSSLTRSIKSRLFIPLLRYGWWIRLTSQFTLLGPVR